MTYELAKQLKKAGFPKEIILSEKKFFRINPAGEFEFSDINNSDLGFIGIVKESFPTLSELIEACGDRFLQISQNPTLKDRKWGAYSIDGTEDKDFGFGSTPEEAVANLWLVLNEK